MFLTEPPPATCRRRWRLRPLDADRGTLLQRSCLHSAGHSAESLLFWNLRVGQTVNRAGLTGIRARARPSPAQEKIALTRSPGDLFPELQIPKYERSEWGGLTVPAGIPLSALLTVRQHGIKIGMNGVNGDSFKVAILPKRKHIVRSFHQLAFFGEVGESGGRHQPQSELRTEGRRTSVSPSVSEARRPPTVFFGSP